MKTELEKRIVEEEEKIKKYKFINWLIVAVVCINIFLIVAFAMGVISRV